MESLPRSKQQTRKLLVVSLLLLVLASVASVSVYFSVTGMAIRSAYVSAPLVIAIAYWLWPKKRQADRVSPLLNRTGSRLTASFASAFFLLELVAVFYAIRSRERDAVYFFLQGCAAVAISVQVVGATGASRWKERLLLVQVGLFTALEVLVKTLAIDTYLGNGDVSYHEFWSQSIMISGHIPSDMGPYSDFPALHVLTAVVSEATALSSALVGLRILFVMAGFFLPFTIYALSERILRDKSSRLVVSIVCSTGYAVLYALGEGVPSALVFLFFGVLLIAGLRSPGRRVFSYLIIGLVVAGALLFTHLVLAGFCAVFLALAVLIWNSYEGRRSGRRVIGMRLAAVTLLSFTGYSLFVSLNAFRDLLLRPVPGTGGTAEVILTTTPSIHALGISLLVRFGLAILFFFSSLTILDLLGKRTERSGRESRFGIGLIGGIALLLYVPGIIGFFPFLMYHLEILRFTLYAELVVLLLASISFTARLKGSSIRRKVYLTIALVFIISGGIVSPENTSDTQTFSASTVHPSTSITKVDLVAYELITLDFGHSVIETDYFSFTYLNARDQMCTIPKIGPNHSIEFEAGTVIYLRSAELSTHGLSFMPVSEGVTEIYEWTILNTNWIEYRQKVNVLCDFGPSFVSEWDGLSQIL